MGAWGPGERKASRKEGTSETWGLGIRRGSRGQEGQRGVRRRGAGCEETSRAGGYGERREHPGVQGERGDLGAFRGGGGLPWGGGGLTGESQGNCDWTG